MSRPALDEILVRITFNDLGEPVKVVRECLGCGGKGPSTYRLETPLRGSQLGTLVSDHLVHCDQSHDMRPKIMCGFKVQIIVGELKLEAGGSRQTMVCTEEKHGYEIEHTFKLKAQTVHRNPKAS
jgi:hypothetical protein